MFRIPPAGFFSTNNLDVAKIFAALELVADGRDPNVRLTFGQRLEKFKKAYQVVDEATKDIPYKG